MKILKNTKKVVYWFLEAIFGLAVILGLPTIPLTVYILLVEWQKYKIPLPKPVSTITEPIILDSISILDSEKEPMCPFYENAFRQKDLKSLSDFSPYIILALLASEDNRFYWHPGIDPAAIASRLVGTNPGGASTITQQLVRSTYPDQIGFTKEKQAESDLVFLKEINKKEPFSLKEMPPADQARLLGILNDEEATKIPRETIEKEIITTSKEMIENEIKIREKEFETVQFKRKTQGEWIASLKLEFFLSKDEILLNYLNTVNLGGKENYGGNRGFEAASQYYLGKSAALLTIEEAATLVAIIPSPSTREIRQNKDNLEIRGKVTNIRNDIIEKMFNNGFITDLQKERAIKTSLIKSIEDPDSFLKSTSYCDYIVTGEFPDLVTKKLAKKGNVIIETSLNINYQEKAEIALKQALAQANTNNKKFKNGAIVTMNTQTGEILAFVGGVNTNLRPPASTFKLFTYLTALEQGKKPTDLVDCKPILWLNGRRCNTYGSKITIKQAVAQSLNEPVFYLGQYVGLNSVVEMAQRLGITTLKFNEDSPLSFGFLIGDREVTLLEMTSAYATVANDGVFNKGHLITRILDQEDCTDKKDIDTCFEMFNDESYKPKSKLDKEITDSMTILLQEVVRSGEIGHNASLGLGEEAGKTGTQDDNTDLWFIGYIPSKHLITGVWLGNEEGNIPTNGSSKDAAILWREYMKTIINE